ncbi:MAG: hypothetical protein EKK64_04955 [Neisseriaceae bacterium]|nr:MAG: hypothetical protein EKK64_04955 [Neisseriaceae bacterium]
MYSILDKNDKTVVFKLPACRRIVYKQGCSFYVSVPSMIFRLRFEKINGFYRYEHSNSVFCDSNKLYHVCFPNTSKNGFVCLGQQVYIAEESLTKFIDAFLSFYWGREFSSEGLGSINLYHESILGNFCGWQKTTKEDENWVPSSSELIKFADLRWIRFKSLFEYYCCASSNFEKLYNV